MIHALDLFGGFFASSNLNQIINKSETIKCMLRHLQNFWHSPEVGYKLFQNSIEPQKKLPICSEVRHYARYLMVDYDRYLMVDPICNKLRNCKSFTPENNSA